MSENETISSTITSIEYRFARARVLVEADVPVRTACRKAGIGKTKYYELLKEHAPASEQARGNSPTARDGNGGSDASNGTQRSA